MATGSMNMLVPLMLIGWFPLTMVLFAVCSASRAAIVSFVAGWLLLPHAQLRFQGLPEFDKAGAIGFAILFSAFLMDHKRILSFRIRPWDLPVLFWCGSPMLTAITNDLGVYDGLSTCYDHTVTFGLPYLLGRVYVDDLAAVRELAIAILIGSILYIPLALLELRLSPCISKFVYGFRPRGIEVRFGGYRPVVFLFNGLSLSLWMSMATLIAICLSQSRQTIRVLGVPVVWLVPLMVVVVLLCKTVGAILLLVMATTAIMLSKWTRSIVPIAGMLLIPLLFVGVRATGVWDGAQAVDVVRQYISPRRARSLNFRFKNENLLVAKALERPAFGWGGYNRKMVFNESGERITIVDGLWINALGTFGIFGMVSVASMYIIPIVLSLWDYRSRHFQIPDVLPHLALILMCVMHLIDCLPNDMDNLLVYVSLGSLTSVYLSGQLKRLQPRHEHRIAVARRLWPLREPALARA